MSDIKETFSSERFQALARQGARRQRLLWANTSTKNPEYLGTKYIEPLIGPDTINTMPLETMNAYRDHGQPAPRLEEGLDHASLVLQLLAEVGIDLDWATQQLEDEGIEKFNKPYDSLLCTLEAKRQKVLRERTSLRERMTNLTSITTLFTDIGNVLLTNGWQDVPFYLRTGKCLPARISEVAIQFRSVPHETCPRNTILDQPPNRLLIAIQPEEVILLRFEAKHPGPTLRLAPIIMQFYYQEAFKTEPPEAYETLLLDIMRGDPTLFMRSDQVEAAWEVISPILEVSKTITPTAFPNYQAVSWGPEVADTLIAQDGRSWIMPTFLQCQERPRCAG